MVGIADSVSGKGSQAGLCPPMGTLCRLQNDPSGATETWWTGQLRPRKRVVLRVSVSRGTLRHPRNDPSGAKETQWTGRLRRSGTRAKRLDLSISVVADGSRTPSAKWRYITYSVYRYKGTSCRRYSVGLPLKGEKEGRLTVWSRLCSVVKPRPIGRPMAAANGLEFQRRPTLLA